MVSTTVYEFCKHKFVTMRFDSWDSWVQIRWNLSNSRYRRFFLDLVFVHDKLKTSRSLMPRVFVLPSLKAIAYGISGEGSQILASQNWECGVSSLLIGWNLGPIPKIPYYMKELATGENFGGLVVVKLLTDNLVKLYLILLERYKYNMFRKWSCQFLKLTIK